jgi:predicted HTH domain antitoxin
MTMTFSIDLPPDTDLAEARVLFALALYKSQTVSLGRAAEIAEVPYRTFFDRALAEGLIELEFSPDELDHVRDR